MVTEGPWELIHEEKEDERVTTETTAMEIGRLGVVLKVRTIDKSHGARAMMEALQFIPGANILKADGMLGIGMIRDYDSPPCDYRFYGKKSDREDVKKERLAFESAK